MKNPKYFICLYNFKEIDENFQVLLISVYEPLQNFLFIKIF